MPWAFPAHSIDGILGFTILARFRLEIDLTQDRMTWTRLDSRAARPAGAQAAGRAKRRLHPLGIQAMSTLGSFAKGLAFFLGKQPEEEQRPRGFLGLEWVEQVETGGRAGRDPGRAERFAGCVGRASAGRPNPPDQPPRRSRA